jgi:endonuclease/exonuclease/phosphatase family metal-dependent hydrolase
LISANYEGCPSHPSRFPKRQLDFIFHSYDLQPNKFNITKVSYSDHAPLVCDFEVRKKESYQAGK